MTSNQAASHLHALLGGLLQATSEAVASRTRQPVISKHERVRTKMWLAELKQGTNVPLWVRNRVHYAVLLLHAVETGVFYQPLDRAPKTSPLPMLPRHTVAKVKAMVNESCDGSILAAVLQNFRLGPGRADPSDSEELSSFAKDRSSSPRRLMFGILGA